MKLKYALSALMLAPLTVLAEGPPRCAGLGNSCEITNNYYEVEHKHEYEYNTIGNPNHGVRLDRARTDIDENQDGVAMAIAAASHQFEVGESAPIQASIAGGAFHSSSAFSIAGGGPIGDRIFLSGHAECASNCDESSFGISATFALE